MKLAIRTCLGDIICKDKELSALRYYVRVNPLAEIVKHTRKGWQPVYPEGIQFMADE